MLFRTIAIVRLIAVALTRMDDMYKATYAMDNILAPNQNRKVNEPEILIPIDAMNPLTEVRIIPDPSKTPSA